MSSGSMEKRTTAHFDIYYEAGSPAARDMEELRERWYGVAGLDAL